MIRAATSRTCPTEPGAPESSARAASAPSRSRTPRAPPRRARPARCPGRSPRASARTRRRRWRRMRAWEHEPLGAQPHLLGGLLAAHIQRRRARPAAGAEHHVRERRLADPRRAAQQHQRARHEPAAEHAVELADARGHALTGAAPTSLSGPPAAGVVPAAARMRSSAPRSGRTGLRREPAPARAGYAPRRACSTPRSRGTARATARTEAALRADVDGRAGHAAPAYAPPGTGRSLDRRVTRDRRRCAR
jgi:hypothetical protein